MTTRSATGIAPVRAGYIKYSPSYVYDPFTRNSWTIQYICAGRGLGRKNGAEHTFPPADCFIQRPGEEVTPVADPNDTWTYVWIGFRSAVALPVVWYKRDVMPAPEPEKLFTKGRRAELPSPLRPL